MMKFTKTLLNGVFIIDIDPIEDERGFFARSFCKDEFKKYGLESNIAQCNIAYNKENHTLRGMHYQAAPHGECKLVRCTRGKIYDVILDLRKDSPSFCKWISVELDEDSCRMVYLPRGCAHGYQTLKKDSVVFYQMSEPYYPELSRGVIWDDPLFGIEWPHSDNRVMSPRDQQFPLIKTRDDIC
jgi:dTDP-4-dehydrorhamnose 3,5-epimerase